MSDDGQRRARGEIERLPSGSLRVRVYAGVEPGSKKRRYLVETVPAGPHAAAEAERVRERLLSEAKAQREHRIRPAASEPDIGRAPRPRPRRRSALTVATIARLAGVSPPTVSKVLNGRSGVAPQTRQRVEDLLLEQGYRRPEKVTRAACVEVAFYGLQSDLAIQLLRGIKRVAVEHGMAVGFTDVPAEAATGRNWAQDLLARRPAGVITVHMGFMPTQHGLLDASGIPLVAVDATSEPLRPVPCVSAANRRGGIAAAEHLLQLGHRRIAVITGPLDRLCARARLDGVRAAMQAAGVPLDDDLIRPGTFFSFDDGLAHGRELLRLPHRPTAVVCGNDLQGFGVYEAARQAGVRIPGQLSVVGFDDITNTRWCAPPMTTVRQPLTEMGATAAELVLALAAGETITQTHIELATTLVIRESTAPPPTH